MNTILIVVTFLVSFTFVTAGPLQSHLRLGGIHEASYSVTLISSSTGDIVGAATILNSEWLITSGFHGYLYNTNDILIDVSNDYIGTVESIILHPKYKWNTWDYNVALIKLKEKIRLNDGILKAADWPLFLYEEGITAFTYKVDDKTLVPSNVTIIDKSICERSFGFSYELKTICVNDSIKANGQVVTGAGLIYDGYLLGIFTNQFNESSLSTHVYLNSADFQDWISHTILLQSRLGQNNDENSKLDGSIHYYSVEDDETSGSTKDENKSIYDHGKQEVFNSHKNEDNQIDDTTNNVDEVDTDSSGTKSNDIDKQTKLIKHKSGSLRPKNNNSSLKENNININVNSDDIEDDYNADNGENVVNNDFDDDYNNGNNDDNGDNNDDEKDGDDNNGSDTRDEIKEPHEHDENQDENYDETDNVTGVSGNDENTTDQEIEESEVTKRLEENEENNYAFELKKKYGNVDKYNTVSSCNDHDNNDESKVDCNKENTNDGHRDGEEEEKEAEEEEEEGKEGDHDRDVNSGDVFKQNADVEKADNDNTDDYVVNDHDDNDGDSHDDGDDDDFVKDGDVRDDGYDADDGGDDDHDEEEEKEKEQEQGNDVDVDDGTDDN